MHRRRHTVRTAETCRRTPRRPTLPSKAGSSSIPLDGLVIVRRAEWQTVLPRPAFATPTSAPIASDYARADRVATPPILAWRHPVSSVPGLVARRRQLPAAAALRSLVLLRPARAA